MSRRDRNAKQVSVPRDRADDSEQKEQELRVLMGRIAGLEQVVSMIIGEGPVEVLARTVDTRERLFVQQELEAIAVGHALHRLHNQHIMIGCDIGVLKGHRDLVLRGRNFVVACFHWHAELIQLGFGLEHARQDSLRNGAEVMVFQLLSLGRFGAEQSPSRVDQVRSREVKVLVDQEVLLFGPGRAVDAGGTRAKKSENPDCVFRQCLVGAEQGGFLIEGFAGPRAKCGGDAKGCAVRVLEDECRARRVPGRVAACFKRGTDAAGREAGCVRLSADQFLAAEFRDRHAVFGRDQERIVFLSGQPGHRLKPVSVVGRAMFHRPFPHRRRYHVRDR